MIHRYGLIVVAAVAFLFAAPGTALPQNAQESAGKPLPLISPIFGDNMVLQRGKENTIWGWAAPGDKVSR